MKIQVIEGYNEVEKAATAVLTDDKINWSWEYTTPEMSKKCSVKAAWIYFITKNDVIMKPGGTGMAVKDRARFYATANNWKDKPGYCNAATNPLIWYHLNQGDKIELYVSTNPIKAVDINVKIFGKIETIQTNPDFRPIEGNYRTIIENYNKENNIIGEDLIWDGKDLQKTIKNLGLKEVHLKENKRIPKGYKVINEDLIKV